jgi:predicted amidohydrolase
MPVQEELNLADFFAQLWGHLAADVPSFERALQDQNRRRSEVLATAASLDDLLTTNGGQAIPGLMRWLSGTGPGVSSSEVARITLVAQAIDRWHAPLSSPSIDTQRRDIRLDRSRRTLLKLGRLNVDANLGYVLPKRPSWGRWSDPDLEVPGADASVWDTFKFLMVVPTVISASDPDDQNQARAVRFSYRLVDPTTLRAVDPDWEPVIGFAPIAEAPDDLDVQLLQEDGKHWYDAQARDLCDRAARAIETLCRAGAHLIVFPEMVVHPNALAAIQTAIATYGPSSQLRMVLAGTSRQPGARTRPFNEAVLFNHRGTEIGRQRKLHRWNLSRDLRDRYGLDSADLEAGADLFEFIVPGEEVLVIEQSQFGRIAVMICEDLARSEPGQWLRKHMLLDWLLTPILDSSMHPSRWMAQQGGKAALGGRCRVVVANSFSLTHRQNAEEERKKTGRAIFNACGIGLCIDVEGGNSRYCLERLPIDGSRGVTCTICWTPRDWRECV